MYNTFKRSVLRVKLERERRTMKQHVFIVIRMWQGRENLTISLPEWNSLEKQYALFVLMLICISQPVGSGSSGGYVHLYLSAPKLSTAGTSLEKKLAQSVVCKTVLACTLVMLMLFTYIMPSFWVSKDLFSHFLFAFTSGYRGWRGGAHPPAPLTPAGLNFNIFNHIQTNSLQSQNGNCMNVGHIQTW